MVATPDLGSGAERRGGSSPFIRTAQATFSGRLFRLIKVLGQLVAPRQCYLRLSNVQSCCATLEYRLRYICSNEFGIYSQSIFQTFGFSAHSLCLHCSNLRQPFEPILLFDNLVRCRTAQATFSGRLFRLIKVLGQLVAPRQTCLCSVVVYYANIRVCCAIVSEKEIFATSPINPDNLRLQQPPFGLLSASDAVRAHSFVR